VQDLWGLYLTALKLKAPKAEKKRNKRPAESDDVEAVPQFDLDSPAEESSSDEDQASTTNSTTSRVQAYRSRIEDLKKFPPLLVSPLFSYLAMVILKIPITLSEIFAYLSPEIPYLQY